VASRATAEPHEAAWSRTADLWLDSPVLQRSGQLVHSAKLLIDGRPEVLPNPAHGVPGPSAATSVAGWRPSRRQRRHVVGQGSGGGVPFGNIHPGIGWVAS
jgi:hypothetical protein